jgi:Pyruvate/2-oxoacid:ferredoxin oxidoreductase delta subunit
MLGILSRGSVLTAIQSRPMPYDRLVCYFLSGTGNSFRAARWLAEAAEERGIASSVIPIDHSAARTELHAGAAQLVGIYHPAHGLMPPWSMIKFLLTLPRGRGAHAAVLATRGGIRIGPVVLPGAAGLGLFFPLLVLSLKGYCVRACLSIDMPINLINVHWGLHPHNIAFIKAWGRRRHDRYAKALLDGRPFFNPLNLVWEFLWPAVLLWLWPIFPIAYLAVGRISMAKIMFADTRCLGCGLCAKYCPNHAIVMTGKKPKVPFWTHRCEACLRCMGYCKPRAIQASHLWMALAIVATSLVTVASLKPALDAALGEPLAKVAWQMASIGLSYLALLLLYYLFWGMQRVRPLHAVWSYLTWTRFFRRRYHDPETSQRDRHATRSA